MLTKLFTYLKHEQQLLAELVSLGEKQQRALIKFDAAELEKIAAYQEGLINSLKKAEEMRIRLLIGWLNISPAQASNFRLSYLEKYLESDELRAFRNMRLSLKELSERFAGLNAVNRSLANRARRSVKQAMSAITDGSNQVCNVKV